MSTSQELAPIQALKAELPTLTRLLEISAGHGVDARAMVEQEIEYLRLLSLTTPAIAECNAATVVLAMKGVLRKNLTLDPGSKLVYAKTRKQKIKGRDGQDKQIVVLELQPSCRGELSYAYQCQTILDHENPQCEYDSSGRVTKVWMRLMKPSSPNPRWEKYEYSEYDFERWRKYSHKDRGRWKDDFNQNDPTFKYANELYTSWRGGIDPEFAKAKCIRRSLDKLSSNLLALPKHKVLFDPSRIAVDVDTEKDVAAAHDQPTEEVQYAEVVSSTAPAEQPASNGSTVTPDEL